MDRIIKVPTWSAPYTFEAWKAAVGAEVCAQHEEHMLAGWHHQQIDPAHVANFPFDAVFSFRVVPRAYWHDGRRGNPLDLGAVDRRLAQAIWHECARLLVRRMTPDAQARVMAERDRAATILGIRD